MILVKILPPSGSIRRRLFFLLGGMSLGALLIADLIWLPSAIDDIRQSQRELRQMSIQLIRDQIQVRLEENESALRNAAQRLRPALAERDREGLHLSAQRFLQSNPDFEEIGILDEKGQELMRLSRRSVITDQDLADRSTSSLFREGMEQKTYWGPVTINETSEPLGVMSVRLPGTDAFLKGLVFGVINFRTLWKLTGKFHLSHQGQVYIVDEEGRLVAAADPSLVLRQLSFADRPFIRRLIAPGRSGDRSSVEGNYVNEQGAKTLATGLLLTTPRWGVVVEQPQAVLFTPIRQKIWLFAGFSLLGLLLSFGLAQILSRRLMRPILRLQEGVQQVSGGNLAYQVAVKTDDEIGALARQFNSMAGKLHDSQEAVLAALTIPVMSHTSEMQETLSAVVAKIIRVTRADAASIRLADAEQQEFTFTVCQGFSEAYQNAWSRLIREGSRRKKILTTGKAFFSEDMLSDPEAFGKLLPREGFRSLAYLPLYTPQKTFGLITLVSREPGRFSVKNADIFKAIAHQISVALQNIMLFQETAASAVELAKTNLAMGIEITERKRMEEQLQHTLDSLRKAVSTTIQVMIAAIETRDPYTAGHQIRSADLARTIATEMKLPPEMIEGIRMAGSIHDIGKLSIPAEILSKPTKLSEIEFSLIKEHAQKGFEMLKNVESPWPLAEIVRQHHERLDGSGYPRQMKGDVILLEARILAVSDVVESMASHRPYRPGLGIRAALAEIEQNGGTLYDQIVVDACLKLFREKGFQLVEAWQ